MPNQKLIDLCLNLISCASITPINDGAIEILENYLFNLGFKTHKLIFEDTTNLYARIGNSSPNICFAGHTDVVPPGDLNKWITPPFAPKIIDDILYGRGAVDMKCAICAFVIAAENYIKSAVKGSISFLLTGDEEKSGKNGTQKVLEWLKQKNEKVTACIVGEPTSEKQLGDIIKIGRRGSITFALKIIGKQGHVAYPDSAVNPITQIVKILHKLQNKTLDTGNKFFQPSNIEITSIDVGNKTSNIIPASANSQFNIRFNDIHTAENLEEIVRQEITSITNNYSLTVNNNAQPFITTTPGTLSKIMVIAIKETLNILPKLSTSGGTSDARYIKDICPVIEFGLQNTTAHKIDECTTLVDIKNLSLIYEKFLRLFFK